MKTMHPEHNKFYFPSFQIEKSTLKRSPLGGGSRRKEEVTPLKIGIKSPRFHVLKI